MLCQKPKHSTKTTPKKGQNSPILLLVPLITKLPLESCKESFLTLFTPVEHCWKTSERPFLEVFVHILTAAAVPVLSGPKFGSEISFLHLFCLIFETGMHHQRTKWRECQNGRAKWIFLLEKRFFKVSGLRKRILIMKSNSINQSKRRRIYFYYSLFFGIIFVDDDSTLSVYVICSYVIKRSVSSARAGGTMLTSVTEVVFLPFSLIDWLHLIKCAKEIITQKCWKSHQNPSRVFFALNFLKIWPNQVKLISLPLCVISQYWIFV